MKIQVISYDKEIKYKTTEHEYVYSSLNAPMSFDAFDLNIISLQTDNLWKSRKMKIGDLDSSKDFQSIKPLICNMKKSKVILCFPQNYTYKYEYYNNLYNNSEQLKDIVPTLKQLINNMLPPDIIYDLIYENSITMCENLNYPASFCFDNFLPGYKILTECVGSEHATTIWVKTEIIFTTLDLSNADSKISAFLKHIGIIKEKQEIPIWIDNYKFLDDVEQEKIVIGANNEIEKQKLKIQTAQEKLSQNLHYKSILFETGDTLVKVVFEILEKILNCNLSDFVDKKDEDFRIALQDVTFIGEIKGITSNVKSENISQLDVHCQTYIDSLDEEGKNENVKGILIINPLRNKSINERDEVNEKQIQLANRNGSLIVTTETLLLLFVAFLEEQITTDKIVELFKNKTGLLKKSDFI